MENIQQRKKKISHGKQICSSLAPDVLTTGHECIVPDDGMPISTLLTILVALDCYSISIIFRITTTTLMRSNAWRTGRKKR